MKEKTVFERPVSRRRVLTASALLAAAGFASSPLAAAVANAVADFGVYEWTACVINCGQRCPLRAYTKKGTVIPIETDNTVKDGCRVRQLRACLKGRDMRERLYSPDRLKYPMKRVGERGEGRFERISWDEALKTVADKLRETVEKYGNESLYWQYCSGQQSLVNSRRAWWRLLNLCGGYLKYYGSYSTAQISAAFPMTYGASPSSDISEIANAKLYVTFGHNPAVTRGSGHGKSWQMTCTREAEGGRKPKMIVIDPIYSDTAVAHADEWIPIRPRRSWRRLPTSSSFTTVWTTRSSPNIAWATMKAPCPLPHPRARTTRATFSAEGPTASRRRPNGPPASRASPSRRS